MLNIYYGWTLEVRDINLDCKCNSEFCDGRMMLEPLPWDAEWLNKPTAPAKKNLRWQMLGKLETLQDVEFYSSMKNHEVTIQLGNWICYVSSEKKRKNGVCFGKVVALYHQESRGKKVIKVQRAVQFSALLDVSTL